ncbi:hypothetical protein Pyn_22835 [Prunus yedoensis var. nudiflora]|uniref:Uncharacterized protein n=1 Tax=Prunus yedoensis var. nudiflora TaxID=2094558 RepID=A0A314UHR5_PRUYE|nr:hypothetical protein Pyn_22835 [Prunus yedoensis var. nudiflora]
MGFQFLIREALNMTCYNGCEGHCLATELCRSPGYYSCVKQCVKDCVVFLNSSSLDDHSSNVVDRCTLECVESAMDILQYNLTNFLASISRSLFMKVPASVFNV